VRSKADMRYPEYGPDHFQKVVNSFPAHDPSAPQISQKSIHKFFGYSANKHGLKQHPGPPV